MGKVAGVIVGLFVTAVVAPVVLLVAMLSGGALGASIVSPWCITDANLGPVLATIRTLESGGDYLAQAAGSTASGAYQFTNPTWATYGGYPRAADAPTAVQDQKAGDHVREILTAHDGDVSLVPVVWYLGHVPAAGSGEWDRVPVVSAGNVLTPREYQTKWMAEYAVQTRSPGAVPGGGAIGVGCSAGGGLFGGPLPTSLDCATIRWGGFDNGYIPTSAMRYRPHSGYLHPAASGAFDELYAAALSVGLDLQGSGYRGAADQADVASGGTGAAVGTSCHGLGIALDIDVLVPGPRGRYRTTSDALASPEFAWLCANAHRFGWIVPQWAIPAGWRCGHVIGTGKGGGSKHVLEPWHIEAPLAGV